jgi:hypothetical protein
MPLMAVAFPILPGKTAEWREFIGELSGARHAEFAESRRRAGVHERTFLQPTPMGDLVIVTPGGDPAVGRGARRAGDASAPEELLALRPGAASDRPPAPP